MVWEETVKDIPSEQTDEAKEFIRTTATVGCRALQRLLVEKVLVESLTHAESAAEGKAAPSGAWCY